MNKKGAGMFLVVIIAVMVFFAGMLIMNFIKPVVDDTRTNLDCTNQSISDGAKLSCIGVDVSIPYFILVIVSVSVGIITARLLI